MKRRDLIALVGAAAVAWPLTVRAQHSSMPVVGWLNPQPLATSQQFFEGFRTGLGEAGFVVGKNVMIDLRPGGGRESLQERADDLIQRGVAVIMAGSPPAALAAKRATQSIPIVFTSGADPVKIGLVTSYNLPGGNVTGVHIQYTQLVGKRLALLHETVPQAARIAVLVNPDHPADAQPTVRNASEAARALGLDIQVFNARTIDDIDAAFAALVRWRAGALLIGPDPFFAARRAQIATLAVRHVLPSSTFGHGSTRAGALMSYAPNNVDNYRQAGVYVGRILKGEKPSELPVQQPTKFELVINLKTAKALGITLSPSILLRADEVIE
ncbi:MAG: putative ABC transport system substrate-binding protein [Gammaproteobacteria bacterium]|jgi:putative ABC transport system substrate-binding protein